jgi:hypothetical protein
MDFVSAMEPVMQAGGSRDGSGDPKIRMNNSRGYAIFNMERLVPGKFPEKGEFICEE